MHAISRVEEHVDLVVGDPVHVAGTQRAPRPIGDTLQLAAFNRHRR